MDSTLIQLRCHGSLLSGLLLLFLEEGGIDGGCLEGTWGEQIELRFAQIVQLIEQSDVLVVMLLAAEVRYRFDSLQFGGYQTSQLV